MTTTVQEPQGTGPVPAPRRATLDLLSCQPTTLIRAQVLTDRGLASVDAVVDLVRCAGQHEPRWFIPAQPEESRAWVRTAEIVAVDEVLYTPARLIENVNPAGGAL